MKQVVLITGANGMLAQHLAQHLAPEYALRFLTRNVTRKNEYLWDLKHNYIDPDALTGVHKVIHLAGSSVVDKRWSKSRKQVILSSRVDGAHFILEALKKQQITIEAFISASGIGYYGAATTDTVLNEKSPKGNDFLSTVCSKWENAAHAFRSDHVANRIAIVRIGIILAKNGGALKKIIPPITYGFGSAIGTGKQYMPWIHIQDLCAIFKFLLNHEHISGTFNGVAPEHITNVEFTKSIAKALNRKIILPNIPRFVIQGLLGEKALILLEGSRVSPDKIMKSGFTFEYDNIHAALNDIIKNK